MYKKYIFHFDSSKPDCDEDMNNLYREFDGQIVEANIDSADENGYLHDYVIFADGSEGNCFIHELEYLGE